MKNRIESMLKKAEERKLLLRSGHLMGHQFNQRMVITEPTKSFTRTEIIELLDSNCLLILDVGNASTKSANNAYTLLKLICEQRGIRPPFLIYGQYWCVNPYLKNTQSEPNLSLT